jgi:hypothetical protein
VYDFETLELIKKTLIALQTSLYSELYLQNEYHLWIATIWRKVLYIMFIYFRYSAWAFLISNGANIFDSNYELIVKSSKIVVANTTTKDGLINTRNQFNIEKLISRLKRKTIFFSIKEIISNIFSISPLFQ